LGQHEPGAARPGEAALRTLAGETPEQHETLRQRYQSFKQLPPEQQERLRQRRDRFRQLPEDKRKALREKWQNMTPEERAAFREKQRQRWQQPQKP